MSILQFVSILLVLTVTNYAYILSLMQSVTEIMLIKIF